MKNNTINPLLEKIKPLIPAGVFADLSQFVREMEFGTLEHKRGDDGDIVIEVQNYTPVHLLLTENVRGIMKKEKFIYKRQKS